MNYKNIHTKLSLFLAAIFTMASFGLQASSHREAPLIAFDPLADNTDVYAFRSPDDTNTVTIIANYIPMQLPHGGPNYYAFGENIRYEIHIDNDATTTGDDIIYRFTFDRTNEDTTTFFYARLGLQNQKNTFTMEKSTDGGASFTTVLSNGYVPPYNVGDRTISSPVGLNAADYESLFNQAIQTANSGETVFCGHTDDPFFVDLGGIFDLGDAPRQNNPPPRDGLACFNVSTIAIKVPISDLQKDGNGVGSASNILDPDFVIGVWASASRPKITTLNGDGTVSTSGDWVQVSRLGMPLTNEVVIPIVDKDLWNSSSPYNDAQFYDYFYNPELALYMDTSFFAALVPAFDDLRVQRETDPLDLDFGNTNDGLFALKGSSALDSTVFCAGCPFEDFLLPKAGAPRSVDINPIFHTGVPNGRPYQLATGKGGNPVAAGKPFIHNFLPNGGDMLRLNMATPVTARNDSDFSSLGLIQAAALGLTDSRFNGDASLQNIPNMDGFPNGRRLEDDVTRIELQAVSGIALAAIGLGYDDPNRLFQVLGYTTGVEENDTTFRSSFPYVQLPWSGKSKCSGMPIVYNQPDVLEPSDTPCTRVIATDGSWMKSTVVQQSTLQGESFWMGVDGSLPDASTFTDTAMVGQPYGFPSIVPVEGSQVIKTGRDITFFRKEFTLNGSENLDARFRATADDQAEIYVNGKRIALMGMFNPSNRKAPAHDVKYFDGMNPQNGFMGGEAFSVVTTTDLDSVFQEGTNVVVVAVRNLSKASDKGGFSFRLDVDSCDNAPTQPACNFEIGSDASFMESSTVTPSSLSGRWDGVMGNLPDSSTYTMSATLGHPYGFPTIDSIDGTRVIEAGNNIRYFRKTFVLSRTEDLDARFQTTVDDQVEIYLNGERILLINSFGKMNFNDPVHDVQFTAGQNPQNGFMGGDSYNFVTSTDLDSLFQQGNNELVFVVRNLSRANDRGGLSFKLTIDSCSAPMTTSTVANKTAAAYGDYDGLNMPDMMLNAYPNPFKTSMTVAYTLRSQKEIAIVATDLSGKQVAVIEEGVREAGQYKAEWTNADLPAGTYFINFIEKNDGRKRVVQSMQMNKL